MHIRNVLAACGASVALLVGPLAGVALAHVEVRATPDATQGGSAALTFELPSEKDIPTISVEITDATMGEGLLVISLKRELPEALKPRSIPINAGTFVPLGRKLTGAIEHQADAQRAA